MVRHVLVNGTGGWRSEKKVTKCDMGGGGLVEKCYFASDLQKQPPRGVPRKRRSENMQQNYRRTHMPKCDFNKVALQL